MIYLSLPPTVLVVLTYDRSSDLRACICTAPRVGGLAREIAVLKRLRTEVSSAFSVFDLGPDPLPIPGRHPVAKFEGSLLRSMLLLAEFLGRFGARQSVRTSGSLVAQTTLSADGKAAVVRPGLTPDAPTGTEWKRSTLLILVADNLSDARWWVTASERRPDLILIPTLVAETDFSGVPVRRPPLRNRLMIVERTGTTTSVRTEDISEAVVPDPEVEVRLREQGIE